MFIKTTTGSYLNLDLVSEIGVSLRGRSYQYPFHVLAYLGVESPESFSLAEFEKEEDAIAFLERIFHINPDLKVYI